MHSNVLKSDVIVVGGGGAGMRAAIAAAEAGATVTLLTKGQAARSGATTMACPSYQAAFAMEDEPIVWTSPLKIHATKAVILVTKT